MFGRRKTRERHEAMTEKQSIFGRITQLARANINALIDQAEDPQKMLDQLVRDYTNSIAEGEVRDAEPLIASQRETVDKLKSGLAQMKDKLGQLKQRRDTLVARQKSAQAQQTVQTAISSINVLDPTSELARFEEKVRREEALAMGQAEIAASSLDSQFAELEADGAQIEIEARLAALKGGGQPQQLGSTPV